MRPPRVFAAGRWWRRLTATLALVVAIAVVIAIVLGTKSPSSLNAAADSHNQSSGAATVQRRDLVQTDTESGTLSYAKPQTVYNRLTGTITWLPAVGQVVKPGQALYRVNGAPVILMDGTTPAYRDLDSSDSDGQDILQLNRNLVALGFNPDGIAIDDEWQAATTAGVELYQESLGETETGSIKLGQIVFLPGPQLISTVDATVGSNGSGAGSNPSNSSASHERSDTPAPEFVGLTTSTPMTRPTTTPTTPTTPQSQSRGARHKPKKKPSTSAQTIATLKALLRAATAQLQAEAAQLRAAQAPNGAHNGNGNNSNNGNSGNHSNNSNNAGNSNNNGGNANDSGGGGNPTAILQTTSTRLVVTVDLDATKQSEAKVGEQVTVELPNGNTVNGKVIAVSSVAQSSNDNGNNGNGNGNNGNGNNGSNGSSGATIPVTVGLSRREAGAGLDQAAVSVNFAEAKAKGVLSVPVTALLATAGGGYAVQTAAEPHKLIPVTTGLFAAGYVEISGAGIYPGLAVTDSQG
jgi:hypothetical protein